MPQPTPGQEPRGAVSAGAHQRLAVAERATIPRRSAAEIRGFESGRRGCRSARRGSTNAPMPNQGSVRHPPVRRARRPSEAATLELPFGRAAAPDTAAPLVPEHATLALLRPAAACCHACHLWELGTQTVFGEGDPDAKLMLVGEQPGDMEDRKGRPFVGPAGKLLDQALAEIGLDRREVYITNVVKHFKWTPRGPRRIHSTPTAPEINACRPWLDAEIAAVRPEVIVCLGATAAQALLGHDFRVTVSRGELLPSPLARLVMATVHPSSLLRTPDEEQRHEGIRRFVADLAKAASAVRGGGASTAPGDGGQDGNR